MSWLSSTVYKAMEVKKDNIANISRIRSVMEIVLLHVGHIVAGGATILQDHIGSEKIESFVDALKRLDEVSISCKGVERIMLLRRLLASLELIERTRIDFISEDINNIFDKVHEKSKSQELHIVSSDDLDNIRYAHLNLRDVILRSHVVEGIALSMILEAPNEEEITLLLEIFRHSLLGKREIHETIMRGIQELAKVFSNYHDEVLLRREELLQYVLIAIRGLKVNADMERIDMKVSKLGKMLYETKTKNQFTKGDDDATQQNNIIKMEIYLKMKDISLKRKVIRDGDSLQSRTQKVNKLKVLLESLAKSNLKAERRILDHRSHKGEALRFRVVKATEVTQLEKVLVTEIETLEKKKEELKFALRKVNASLTIAKTSLRNVREEKDQFYEASNRVLQDLQLKEEDQSKSITSSKSEAKVVIRWLRFVEDTWNIKLAITQQTEKNNIEELKTHSHHQAKTITDLLLTYKVELENLVTRFRILIGQLKPKEKLVEISHLEDESFPIALTRRDLEEEYLDLEFKLITAFDLVEGIKQPDKQREEFSRNDEKSMEELFSMFEKINQEFQSLERPSLECEPQKQLIWQGSPLKLKLHDDLKKSSFTRRECNNTTMLDWNLLDLEDGMTPHSDSAKRKIRKDSIDWEFDALGT